jgi:hypothetical protein
MPFHYTKAQAVAIRQTLITGEVSLQHHIKWPALLKRLEEEMSVIQALQTYVYSKTSRYNGSLSRGETIRRLTAFIKTLDATVRTYEGLGPALQFDLDVRVHAEGPWGARGLPSWAQFRKAIQVMQRVAALARMTPGLIVYVPPTGRPEHRGLKRAIHTLLGLFEWATGIPPKVYASEHNRAGYGGNFYRFAVAALTPVFPTKPLGSNILAAYKKWRLAKKKVKTPSPLP